MDNRTEPILPEEFEDIRDMRFRLVNWVDYRAWAQADGPAGPRCTLGMFSIPERDEERREPRREQPDMIDGLMVDKCVCALPESNRNVIMGKWLGWLWISGRRVNTHSIGELARKLGMSRASYYRMIRRSELMLKNILTRK